MGVLASDTIRNTLLVYGRRTGRLRMEEKPSDTITRIDQLVDEKPLQVWPPSGPAAPDSDVGAVMTFTLEDGAIRKVKLAYYF